MDFWDQELSTPYISSTSVTSELVNEVEEELGFKLPAIYIQICQLQNGGVPKRQRISDILEIKTIFPLDKLIEERSNWLEQWQYPNIGIYFANTWSDGHDMLALDYRQCGRNGEPMVVHVDQEANYRITPIASNLESFLFQKLQYKNQQDEQEYEVVRKEEPIIIGEQRKFVYLESLKKKSYRFYEMKVEGCEITIRYGRIDSRGKVFSKVFPNHQIAATFFEKKLREQKEAGYEEVNIVIRGKDGKIRQLGVDIYENDNHLTLDNAIEDDEIEEEDLVGKLTRSQKELKIKKDSLDKLQLFILLYFLGSWFLLVFRLPLTYTFPLFFVLILLYNLTGIFNW